MRSKPWGLLSGILSGGVCVEDDEMRRVGDEEANPDVTMFIGAIVRCNICNS